MKKYIAFFLLAVIFTSMACKKKKETLPSTMTVVVDKDTVWTTTNVATDASNAGKVYITGTNSDGIGRMDIAISNYQGIKGTFQVDNRGPGGNIYGNTGTYKNASTTIDARTGKIVVTEVTDKLIKGTFDLYFSQTNIKGSFTAPAH